MATAGYEGYDVLLGPEYLSKAMMAGDFWEEALAVDAIPYPPPREVEEVNEDDCFMAMIGLAAESVPLDEVIVVLGLVVKSARASGVWRRRLVENRAFEGIKAVVAEHFESEKVLRLGAEALALLLGRDVPATEVDEEQLRFIWGEARACGGSAAAHRILQAAGEAGEGYDDVVGLVHWVVGRLDNPLGWCEKTPYHLDAWGRSVGQGETGGV